MQNTTDRGADRGAQLILHIWALQTNQIKRIRYNILHTISYLLTSTTLRQ